MSEVDDALRREIAEVVYRELGDMVNRDYLIDALMHVVETPRIEHPMIDSADKDAPCKHCGRPIRNGRHAAGRQHGLQRCDSRDSGLRYGYSAETADEPCSIACLGSVTPSAATKDPS